MRLALVTCQKYPNLTDDDRLLIPVLEQAGHTSTAVSWDAQGVNWPDFDCVILRSTWDYHLRTPEFTAWLAMLAEQNVKVLNPIDTVQWNLHKSYLRDIQQSGIPIVPTHWVEQGKNGNLRTILEHHNWNDVIVKPAVSATAYKTFRIREQELDAHTDRVHELSMGMDMLIQPFVPEVQSHGEWSFIFFGGEYSHAVLKKPKDGDFRSQPDFGGRVELHTPRQEFIQQARSVLSTVSEPLLYARVDGVEIDGTFHVIELELIEPMLFFAQDAQSTARFSKRLTELLKSD